MEIIMTQPERSHQNNFFLSLNSASQTGIKIVNNNNKIKTEMSEKVSFYPPYHIQRPKKTHKTKTKTNKQNLKIHRQCFFSLFSFFFNIKAKVKS